MKSCLLVLLGIAIGVIGIVILLVAMRPRTQGSGKITAGAPDVEVKVYEPYLNRQLSDVLSHQFSNYVESSSLDVKPHRTILVTIQAKIPKDLGSKGIVGSILGIVTQVQGGKVTVQLDSSVSVSGGRLSIKVESIKLGRLPVQRSMLAGPLGQMLEAAENEINTQLNSRVEQTGLVPTRVESDEQSLTIYLKMKQK